MTNINSRLGISLVVAICSLWSANAQTNSLKCAGTTVSRDEVQTVDIALKNDVDFTAFQCDINIPETVRFVDNEGIIKASPRLAESHRIIEKKLNDNTLRVIVYSTDNSAFSNDTETLCEQALARMQVALSEILVEGINTNVPLHRQILSDLKFMQGGTSIHYLEERLAEWQAVRKEK